MGNYSGGRLWIESPLGLYPPPCATEKRQKDLHWKKSQAGGESHLPCSLLDLGQESRNMP